MEKLELKIDKEKKQIYAPLKDKWLVATPEELVRQQFICNLVNKYGYALNQIEQELKVSNSSRGQGKARADIVIWRNEQDRKDRKAAFIVVECKAENVKIQKADYYQGLNYATWAKAKFFVTTNEKDTKFFRILDDKIPDELDEIINIPSAADIDNEKKIQEILSQRKTFSKVDFQNLLFKCHNVFRDNDALAPDAAFDEISKILFMKITYERNRKSGQEETFNLKVLDEETRIFEERIKPGLVIQNPNFENSRYIDFWFEETKTRYKQEKLFEANDKIKISIDSFRRVVKELEVYNLSDTDDDIKGVAFEEFLSKTFRGKGLGQFFTPRTIVKFMTEILDPKENEKICDPCCGSGGFLIYSFEYIRNQIENDIENQKIKVRNQLLKQLENQEKLTEEEYEKLENKVNEQIEKAFTLINKDLNNKIENTRLQNLSYKCIFGTDKEARSARLAKMNMIMHGDGHGGVHQYEGLLNINGIKDGIFDVILTNPPFGSRITDDLKDPDDKEKTLAARFKVSEFSTLKEVMFTDRCLNLLKPGGRLAIVLPEGFLNTSNLQNARDYFETRAKILFICSIPQDVFIRAGATVKPSLLFLKKFTEEEQKLYTETVETVTKEINEKYQPEIDKLNADFQKLTDLLNQLNEELKTLKKELKKKDIDKKQLEKDINETTEKINEQKTIIANAKIELKQKLEEIENRKQNEIKAEVKLRFDYEIPVAQVEKAGITSTGAPCENELDEVVTEFAQYRKNANLWQIADFKVEYHIDKNEVKRVISNQNN